MALDLDSLQGPLDKLQRIPHVYRVAMVPLVCVLIVAVYAYFFYRPASAERDTLQAELETLQKKVSEVRAIVSNLTAFERELAELEERLAQALRRLPDSKELPVLLADITALGKDSGLEIKAFRPQGEIPRDFYAEVPIAIEFDGVYHDIASFFDRIAKLPRIVNIGQLNMNVATEATQTTVLRVTGQATTFRFLETTPAAADVAAAGTP